MYCVVFINRHHNTAAHRERKHYAKQCCECLRHYIFLFLSFIGSRSNGVNAPLSETAFFAASSLILKLLPHAVQTATPCFLIATGFTISESLAPNTEKSAILPQLGHFMRYVPACFTDGNSIFTARTPLFKPLSYAALTLLYQLLAQ